MPMLSSNHLTQAPRHPSLLSNQSRQEASTVALVSIRRSNPTSGLLLAPTARLTSILFAPALSLYGRAQGSISIHPPKCISAPFPKPRFALFSSVSQIYGRNPTLSNSTLYGLRVRTYALSNLAAPTESTRAWLQQRINPALEAPRGLISNPSCGGYQCSCGQAEASLRCHKQGGACRPVGTAAPSTNSPTANLPVFFQGNACHPCKIFLPALSAPQTIPLDSSDL